MHKFTDLHDPEFAWNNDHWGVRPNGTIYSQKPLSFGVRMEHTEYACPLLANDAGSKFKDWPYNGDHPVNILCRTREDAVAVHRLILTRALDYHLTMMRIIYNADLAGDLEGVGR